MKLVRDRMPEIAQANNFPMKTRKARPDELLRLLKEKLVEEATELLNTSSEGGADEAEEMADVLEVVNCLLQMIDGEKLVAAATLKAEAKGHITDIVWVQDTDPQ